ncbi:hypothetical protein RHGRI_030757 [Rhododendron griersonianum]|uniref:Uncharacterized protein n=1 Tax=Rhododendron griersonianum TaxID=479676 RepID=A0AAV6I937_9ERIC|nr:hypothetical protein RHGRI_030757 [Rhododendron griersonianum]
MSLPTRWQTSLLSSSRRIRLSSRPYKVKSKSFVLSWWTWRLLLVSIWPRPGIGSRPPSCLMKPKVPQRMGLSRGSSLGP